MGEDGWFWWWGGGGVGVWCDDWIFIIKSKVVLVYLSQWHCLLLFRVATGTCLSGESGPKTPQFYLIILTHNSTNLYTAEKPSTALGH